MLLARAINIGRLVHYKQTIKNSSGPVFPVALGVIMEMRALLKTAVLLIYSVLSCVEASTLIALFVPP